MNLILDHRDAMNTEEEAERVRPLRPNGPPEPSPGLSAAMPWDRRPHTNQRPERAREL